MTSKILWILKENGNMIRNSEVLIVDGEDEVIPQWCPRVTSPRMTWSIDIISTMLYFLIPTALVKDRESKMFSY